MVGMGGDVNFGRRIARMAYSAVAAPRGARHDPLRTLALGFVEIAPG